MSRTSSNEIIGNRLINGYDYTNQCWVVNGYYVRCGHPPTIDCGCFGKTHAGIQTAPKGEAYFEGWI